MVAFDGVVYVEYIDFSFGDGDLIGKEGEDDKGSSQGKASHCLEQGSMVYRTRTHLKQEIHLKNGCLMPGVW